jgi:hypothetical protein
LQLFIVTFIQIMLPREQRIPTAIPRELDHRDLVVQGGNHVRGQLLLVRNEKTHLHEKSLLTHQANKKGDASLPLRVHA